MNKCIESVLSCISDPSPELIKARQINLLRSFPVMVLSKALKITCNSGTDILCKSSKQNEN